MGIQGHPFGTHSTHHPPALPCSFACLHLAVLLRLRSLLYAYAPYHLFFLILGERSESVLSVWCHGNTIFRLSFSSFPDSLQPGPASSSTATSRGAGTSGRAQQPATKPATECGAGISSQQSATGGGPATSSPAGAGCQQCRGAWCKGGTADGCHGDVSDDVQHITVRRVEGGEREREEQQPYNTHVSTNSE